MGGMASTSSTTEIQQLKGVPQQKAGSENDRNVVVIPVDGSKQAEAAFDWYVVHVHKSSNDVHIVHSHEVEYPSGKYFPDYAIPPEQWAEKMKQAQEDGRNLVSKYEARMREMKMSGNVHSSVGPPGNNIISVADAVDASMIVMGTRGMGLVRRTILGSVSDYVIHHTRVPVTVVPDSTAKRFFG